jgi:predicted transcriptional regulator
MDSVRSLTRKGATCTDLLSCLYGLKPIETEVFLDVARRGTSTVDDVSAAVGRDRTTTHRCLAKLASAGLVYRRTSSLKGGGYYHTYAVVESQTIKSEAAQRVREVAESLQRLVDDFDADLQRRLGEKDLPAP